MSAAVGALLRACAVCGREFRPRTLIQRLCSLECVARHPRPRAGGRPGGMYHYACEVCGKAIDGTAGYLCGRCEKGTAQLVRTIREYTR